MGQRYLFGEFTNEQLLRKGKVLKGKVAKGTGRKGMDTQERENFKKKKAEGSWNLYLA